MTERELLDRLARDVAEALTAIADREESWAGVTRSFASSIYARHARPVADSHQPGADSHQQQATIPPADADDAGTRLVAWLVERDAPVLVDLARDVIRERDEARRALDVSQSTLRDALAREVDATARADAAEKDRDEARRERDAAEEGWDAERREKNAQWRRADAAEATVRKLRELCEEMADHITPTAYVHIAKLAARLRAAAVQPASEGRADA